MSINTVDCPSNELNERIEQKVQKVRTYYDIIRIPNSVHRLYKNDSYIKFSATLSNLSV